MNWLPTFALNSPTSRECQARATPVQYFIWFFCFCFQDALSAIAVEHRLVAENQGAEDVLFLCEHVFTNLGFCRGPSNGRSGP